MTTLREVLQQALEAMEQDNPAGRSATIIALKAALAQEEQGPVLVVEKEPDYMSRGHFYEGSKSFIDPTEVWKLPIGTKLYTHPPRREWRELTEEEIRAAYGKDLKYRDGDYERFARAIEAKLKEKNK
jgi:hypothetical protein